MHEDIIILVAGIQQQLLQKYAEWKRQHPAAKNVEIHYSHSLAYRFDPKISESCPEESYSMLILWDN